MDNIKLAPSYTTVATSESLQKTLNALKLNGIDAFSVPNGVEAKKKVFELIPLGAEVMTMSSITLEGIGITDEIQNSNKYKSVRNVLSKMDKKTQGHEMRQLSCAPDWVIGSVQAVTEDGKYLTASGSGSQLPAYAYGATHVILVVGTHKIVANTNEGIKRIYDYSLPLENDRVKKVYGHPSSSVSKVLAINADKPRRTTVIFVNEALGF